MAKPKRAVSLMLVVLLYLHLSLDYTYTASSVEDAISKAIKSMESSLPGDVETIAIWRIDNRTRADLYVFELLDNLELTLINSPRFNVVDRNKLSKILEEQKFSETGFVDPERRKRLGEVTGVDAFLYGEITDTSKLHEGIDEVDYYTTLHLRLLDVKTGTLVWEKEIQGHNEQNIKELLEESPKEYSKSRVEDVTEKAVMSLEKQIGSEDGITTLAIWRIDDDTKSVDMDDLYDKLSFQLSKRPNFRVVDRSNINLLLQEQKLSMERITDQGEQEKIGKMWGIDGFIFGRIPKDGVTDEGVRMSLRAIDVDSGVLVWGESVTGKEHYATLPEMEYKKRITSLPGRPKKPKVYSMPGRPKKSEVYSIPGKNWKPEFEYVKQFSLGSDDDSAWLYLGSMAAGAVGVGLSSLRIYSEGAVLILILAAALLAVGIVLDYNSSPSVKKPILENIEYNRQLDEEMSELNRRIKEHNAPIEAEITRINREIDEHNAPIEAEIERINREIKEWNKKAESRRKANILMRYLRLSE